MKLNVLVFILTLFFISCMQQDGGGTKRNDGGETEGLSDPTSPISQAPGSNNSGSTDTTTSTDDQIDAAKVDIRHVVDPYSGAYKTKVTIPKNYGGLLYLSGLNISTLQSKFTHVRFKFGLERTAKILPAVPSTAPNGGIVPQTDIDVLVIDLKDRPFKNLRLFYDLYDYNDYDSDDNGVEFEATDSPNVPVSDIKDSGLYCRGLNLEDDPTFAMSTTNNECDQSGEICLYTYASIEDAQLTVTASSSPSTPSKAQLNTTATSFTLQSQSELLSQCLPDTHNRTALETSLQTSMLPAGSASISYGDTAYAGAYTYHGPYRRLDQARWQIKGKAVFSPMNAPGTTPSGLFQFVLSGATVPTNTVSDPSAEAEAGLKSFLFPRFGKVSYQSGKEYVGLTSLTSPITSDRTIRTMLSNGDSEYMDGCNIRKSYSDYGSCNVTGTIEVGTLDANQNFVPLASTSKVKIQLTRDSNVDDQGNEHLFDAFRMCDNSSACGSNECCYNNRCWSKDLVSQCKEDSASVGDLLVGESCSSDTQCLTLCCSDTTNSCASHDSSGGNNSCGKSVNASCISKEFCQESTVKKWIIVRTGDGPTDCALQSFPVSINGDCVNGTCQQAQDFPKPAFDSNDPNRCLNAESAPTNH